MTSPQAAEQGPYTQQFSVPFSYSVYFTDHVFQTDNPIFARALSRTEPNKRHRFAVFIDSGVASVLPNLPHEIVDYAAANAASLQLADRPGVLSGGEAIKNDLQAVESLQQRMAALNLDRHSFVIIIGGGAFLDMVGYAAATVHRGLRVVRLPTTVLGQADSGVGVKTAVNAFQQKNLLGVFAPPFAVINDTAFLKTLDGRDLRAGMAEAVKVALIRDRDFFEVLEKQAPRLAEFEPGPLRQLVRRCAELHMHQIARGGDPFETGSARPLDFGHWAAHKLEVLTGHGVRHGEAVAIGMALDARYSVLTGLLESGAEERVCSLLERLGFTLWHDSFDTRTDGGELAILAGLQEFREHLGGDLTITLLRGIGVGQEVNEMDEDAILQSVAWLRNRAATG